MANARAVEEVSKSGKTRKKTSVFWSTVPENEQFKNVQVPGVALGGLKDAKKNSQVQKYAQVVQKSKSDSAILNTRSDSLTVNKPGKVGHELAIKQNDLAGKKKDVSSIFKGAVSSDQLANMSSLSESSNPRRASLKNLNVEDKKRVANLIKELAKTGEERELALERLQEERVSFDERLGAVQDEQTALRQEREALKQRLEKSEKLLKKYESELKDVKTEKEEQEKILKKKFQAQPQSTQTSPSIQTLSTHSTIKSRVDGIQPRGIKKTLSTQVYAGDSESNDRTSRDGRMRWGSPQVPVYSNSLFDVKVSNVEHEQSSESQSVNEEYQRSNVVESGGLHELYLREYSLQLRLQEQQIEIQRQQVQLQQQLQLLQQQQQQQQGVAQQRQEQHNQQQHNQQQHLHQQQQQELAPKYQANKEQQHPNQQQQQEHHRYHQQQQRQREISNKSHKQQTNQHSQNVDQKHQQQPSLNQQQPYDQPSKWHQQEPQYLSTQNNETMSKHSPTQQTNLLQKRTPEPRGQHIEPKHEADIIPHEHSDLLPRRHKHDHHTHVVKNSRHENEAVLYEQYGEPRSKDRSYTRQRSGGPSSHNHYHHSRNDGENTSSVGEYHTSKNKAQRCTDSTHYRSEQHHMTKTKSPRKHNRTNDVKQVDVNNNEYFQPRSHSPKQQKNHYDVNGNLVQDHYPQSEYLSEPYSETDDQADVEHHCSSERPCHCGYYRKHTRQQHLTSEYDHPISKHSHSKGIPQHGIDQKSPQSIAQNPHLEAEPHPTQTYHHPKRHQLSPNRTKGYHQKLMHDPNHAPVPPLGHHHEAQYRHYRGTREEHSSQRNDHYQHVPHYVTHKHQHANEPASVIYQASQETSSGHEPTEHRVYVRHQSGSPTNAQLPPSTNTQLPQVGITEYDHLPSDGLQQPRTQMNQDKSQDLLDDYIYNHQTAGQYNAKFNADYPKDKSNNNSTKRKISRLREADTIQESEHGYPPTTYTASQQPQYEDENPGYSLYKPNIQETTWKQSEHPGRSPGHNHGQYSRPRSKSYPDSLVEIVEDLEINDGYEERYSEETEVYSTEELGFGSDEEESTVLDNIFFLKR